MKPMLAFLLIAVLGNVLYHVGQKSLAPGTNPMTVLMVVYAMAFAFAGLAAPFFRGGATVSWSAQFLAWPVVAVALGVLLIEIGFLLAYRTGGSIQWAGVAVNGLAALLLVPFAIFIFREKFSLLRMVGIALTLSGMTLLTRH